MIGTSGPVPSETSSSSSPSSPWAPCAKMSLRFNKSPAHMGMERGHYAKVDDSTTASRKTAVQTKSRRAPLMILLTLTMGLGIALAQHFTYVHLNNKRVDHVPVSQAWILRFGTALAFLVKMCFGLSVATSFVQHQWLCLHGQDFQVKEVDTLTSVLTNVFGFLNSTVWGRQPILASLALVSWIVPLSAVVAPGSLTVAPVRRTNVQDLLVPQPLFNGSGYGTFGGEGPLYGTLSMSTNLRKLAFATASSSEPVPMQSAPQNESYALEFYAPAVRCGSANDSIIRNATLTWGTQEDYGGSITNYASWVSGDAEVLQNLSDTSVLNPIDEISSDGAHLFVLTNTGSQPDRNITVAQSTWYMVNLTECILYNATYSVEFDFQFPNQTRQVTNLDWLHPVSPAAMISQPEPSSPLLQYSLVMASFGQLLVGLDQWSHYGFNTTWLTNWEIIDIDWSDAEAVQQGLEQLFQNLTISLFSDSTLTESISVSTVITSWPSTYVYNSFDLYLSYGLALLASLICAIFGLRAFFLNDGSYQNVFSTFLRATGDHEVWKLLSAGDMGADPLPKKIGEARFALSAEEEPVELRAVTHTSSSDRTE